MEYLAIIIVIGAIYILAWFSHFVFLRKIYALDIARLERKKKSEVAAMRTKMIKEGTMRYASQTAKGIVGAVEQSADEQILRRKLKYRQDVINSFVTAITQFFKR